MANFFRAEEPGARLTTDLERAVRHLRITTGLPLAFGGFAVEHGVVPVTEVAGGVSGALSGVVITRGRGLGGKVIARGRPEAVSDYHQASTITHHYDLPVHQEGLQSVLAVPVLVRPTVRALLYVGLRQSQPLGDRVLAAASAVAEDLRVQIQVTDEVEQRLAGLDATKKAPGAYVSSKMIEELRAIHAELSTIANRLDDPDLQRRVRAAGHRMAKAINGTGSGGRGSGAFPRLSEREIDVLAQVALGCTNAEAGQRLGLLPETVKSYLRSAANKLGSHTRIEAVVAARSAGLLP